MKNATCFFCGSTASEFDQISYVDERIFVKCPVCGRYEYTSRFAKPEYKDIVAAYLYHHEKNATENDDLFYYFLGTDDEFSRRKQAPSVPVYHATIEEIKAFYPRTFTQRVERSLLAIAKKSEYYGNVIVVPGDELFSLLFIRRFDNEGNPLVDGKIKNQYLNLLRYFEHVNYTKASAEPGAMRIQLQADGWKAIEKLQSSPELNRNVFVSMAFNDDTKDTRDAIKAGIINAEFSPEFIDEIIHNKQIVPEMFRLIRECRFLILDISDPNYGAYYEAGYALGLGKEVIITCSEEVFRKEYKTEEEKKYMKYLRPHFDIAQKQILVWKNHADLTKQLSEWIKALFN